MAISWMQRHKKWLIVTIWISTIAFVGAGFVGWGSYNYGKTDGTVAVVGDKEIPLNDLQNEYSMLYSQYNQMLGGQFNQELAKQFKLEEIALQKVIQKYLLLNYAKELGLITTDLEVAKELVKIPTFFKDGKFDSNTYRSVLKQNRRTTTEFEEQLKQDLLVAKVQKIFNLDLQQNEIQNLNRLLFSEDKVSLKVINGDNIKVYPSHDDLKKYYEDNKQKYKSLEGFDISFNKIQNLEAKDKKAMKKVALKEYLALKKGNKEFTSKKVIYSDGKFLNDENFKKVTQAKVGTTLKPIYKDDSYYVIKLNKKVDPQTLLFKEVKSKVNKEYIALKRNEQLDKLAKENLDNFTGKDIGFISRNSNIEIEGLSADEVSKFIQSLFNSNKQTNYINLNNKIVVYKITDSKIGVYDQKNDQLVKSSIQNAKINAITTALLDKLKNRYNIKSYLAE